ncbi:MAG: flavin reductase family protein [Tistlia sp.]|uniref:flavin reductase family protein n=1 Tax=Tistlia sp. TaxID=3057121 RepID=UPI0034A21746
MHFYEPKDGHRLAYDPFKAIVAPRPIGWISTIDAEGRPNLGPYSFFNALSSSPPIVAFSSEGMKDSPANAEATGEFVFNLSTLPLARQMNASSAMVARGVNEFELAGLTAAPSRLVRAPRVAESPAALECRLLEVLHLKDLDGRQTDRFVVFGQVVGVHIDERYLKDGYFDTAAAQPLARCGYRDFAAVTEVFALLRPEEEATAAK